MYPVLVLVVVSATLAGMQTKKTKLKVAASAILILTGIFTVWFTFSQIFH